MSLLGSVAALLGAIDAVPLQDLRTKRRLFDLFDWIFGVLDRFFGLLFGPFGITLAVLSLGSYALLHWRAVARMERERQAAGDEAALDGPAAPPDRGG